MFVSRNTDPMIQQYTKLMYYLDTRCLRDAPLKIDIHTLHSKQ